MPRTLPAPTAPPTPGTRVSWGDAGKRRTGVVAEWAGATPTEVCVEVVNGAYAVSYYLPIERLTATR